ncbi:MAG TPA: helix-turn-helix domain-containing protein [Bradyrhizobium sp.]|nr:helix-turn-helix domain-containing protein [Bradyrhizobium sp.]
MEPPLHDVIAALPLFSGLSAGGLRSLLNGSVVQQAARGIILFEQGAEPTFQAVVLEGAVHLLGRSVQGQEMVIDVVEAPGLLLPAAVVSGAPYLMRAQCIEDVRILMIKADVFRALLSSEPQLALAMINCLSDQFRAMVRQIKTLKLRPGPQRVAAYLLALTRRQGNENNVTLPYEKGLIASQLGMTRESFSRILATLQRDIIHVDGQKVHIRNRHALLELSAPDPMIDGPDA